MDAGRTMDIDVVSRIRVHVVEQPTNKLRHIELAKNFKPSSSDWQPNPFTPKLVSQSLNVAWSLIGTKQRANMTEFLIPQIVNGLSTRAWANGKFQLQVTKPIKSPSNLLFSGQLPSLVNSTRTKLDRNLQGPEIPVNYDSRR